MFRDDEGQSQSAVFERTAVSPYEDRRIDDVAWSPNGRYIAYIGSGNGHVWDLEAHQSIRWPDSAATVAAWSSDGKYLATGSSSGVRIWTVGTWRLHWTLDTEMFVRDISWSPDAHLLLLAFGNGLAVWDPGNNAIRRVDGHGGAARVRYSPTGRYFAAFLPDLEIYDMLAREWLWEGISGNRDVSAAAWSPDEASLAFACGQELRLFDKSEARVILNIEGHTSPITSLAYSPDGKMLASISRDESARLFIVETWEQIGAIGRTRQLLNQSNGMVVFHPTEPLIAMTGQNSSVVEIWQISASAHPHAEPSLRYATARIVLVGDSGVGKTGLGWRIARNEFKEHASTHGQQFWVVDALQTTRADGVQCEAVLWDLAGQPDYRLVHALYLDDVDLALIIFDPTDRKDPMGSVDYWLKQLHRNSRPWRAILVGARVDRGAPSLTLADLDAYCSAHNIPGGYISTSAKSGVGIDGLMERIQQHVSWTQLSATVTTSVFKAVKDYVLSLKSAAPIDLPVSELIVSLEDLVRRLRTKRGLAEITTEHVLGAVRHLGTHGYVTLLRRSTGGSSILLKPEVLIGLASSIVNEARGNIRGLGALEEERLLRGDYRFPELENVPTAEREVLIDATVTQFLRHTLCFRETLDDRRLLVFPSLINERRPQESVEVIESVMYKVTGAVENLYASLVVLLGYTTMFKRTNQWQDRAQYVMEPGEICGFRQSSECEGELQLVLYYGVNTPEHARMLFQGQFERFLSTRDFTIQRYAPVVCVRCEKMLQWSIVIEAIDDRHSALFCSKCGRKNIVPRVETLDRRTTEAISVQHRVAQRRTRWEAALVSINRTIREQRSGARSCFICYAWGKRAHEEWVATFADDLQNAGVEVLIDRYESGPGSGISHYIDRLASVDFVVVVGTPELRRKYDRRDGIVEAELRIIQGRIRQPRVHGDTVIPIILDGNPRQVLPPLLQDVVWLDFRDQSLYFRTLLDLVWSIFELPRKLPVLADLFTLVSE